MPAYYLEINPAEAMGNHAKYAKLANCGPGDIEQLDAAVHASLDDQAQDHRIKLSFLKTTQLRL